MVGNGNRMVTEKLGSQEAWHGIRESQDLSSAPNSATAPLCELEQVPPSLPGPGYP